MFKVCRKCNMQKDISHFHRDKNGKDGFRNECKACRKIYLDQYYTAHREVKIKRI